MPDLASDTGLVPHSRQASLSNSTLIALILGLGVGGGGTGLLTGGATQAIEGAEARIVGKIEALAVHVSNARERIAKVEDRLDGALDRLSKLEAR